LVFVAVEIFLAQTLREGTSDTVQSQEKMLAWILLVVSPAGLANEMCIENYLDPECMNVRNLLGLRKNRKSMDGTREDTEDTGGGNVHVAREDFQDEWDLGLDLNVKPWGWGRCWANWDKGCPVSFKKPPQNHRDNCIQRQCWLNNLTWNLEWKACECIGTWCPNIRFQGQCVPRESMKLDTGYLWPEKKPKPSTALTGLGNNQMGMYGAGEDSDDTRGQDVVVAITAS